MSQAVKKGDTIRIHYTGKLEDGQVFDTSEKRGPLEFEAGKGVVVEGMDEAVIGMTLGEKKTVTIPPEKGYGLHDKTKMIEVPKDKLPPDVKPTPGQALRLVDKEGKTMVVTIAEVLEKTIRLDVNHFLAGKTMVFDIELVEIV